MTNMLNAPIAGNWFGDVVKLKLSLVIGTTELCHNRGVEIAEHAKEARKTVDTHPARGTANPIAVHDMTVPVMTIE